MDLVALIRSYVERMLADVPGMKVLLLDAETTKIVSTVYSQSEILEQEVYLVEKLDDEKGDQLFHLKASSEHGRRQRAGGQRAGERSASGSGSETVGLYSA